MGIPKFFGWVKRGSPFETTIKRLSDLEGSVDVLGLDLNGIFYENVYKFLPSTDPPTHYSPTDLSIRYNQIFRGIVDDIIRITRAIRPQETLMLDVDGVAPQAKINQQRSRRYKARSEWVKGNVFDPASITPGTDFMKSLDGYLTAELRRISQLPTNSSDPYARVLPPRVVYSSHLVPGEGEHKIIDAMREISAKGKTAVIYGADADLFMIYLMALDAGWKNIFLFRESEEKREDKFNPGTSKMVRRQAIVDLGQFREILIKLYPGVIAPVDDFVTLLFLNGNDFLPHFPVFERIPDALQTLIGGYRQFLEQNPGKGITDGRQIVWSNFGKFLDFISDNYNLLLLSRWATNEDAMIKIPSMLIEKCTQQDIRMVGSVRQCVRTFQPEVFNQEWYRYIFLPKIRKPETDLSSYLPTLADQNEMIGKYLEGLTWVYTYYRSGVDSVNIGWYYPYHYAPLFSDLGPYIRNNPATWDMAPIMGQTDFLPLPVQLLMVMPPEAVALIPEKLRILYAETSPIYDLFPDSFLIDKQGKMEAWQAISLLPFPLANRVWEAIKSLNLPDSFFQEYAPQEPIEFSSGGLGVFRRTRGRGRGSYGRGGYYQQQGYQQTRGRGSGRGEGRESGRGRERGGNTSPERGRGGRGSGRGSSRGQTSVPTINPIQTRPTINYL